MNKKIYLSILLIVALVMAGCTGGGIGGGSKLKADLSGKIYDDSNHLVQESVYLEISGTPLTTTSGTYSFSNLTPGKKELTVESKNYQKYSEEIVLQEGNKIHDIYLKRKSEEEKDTTDKAKTLIENVRNAGLSFTQVWEPELNRLNVHLEKALFPFSDELGSLTYAIMEPLDSEDYDFEFYYDEENAVLMYSAEYYTLDDWYEWYTVVYEIEIKDFLENWEKGKQDLIGLAFTLTHERSGKIVAKGQGLVEIDVVDPRIYNDWVGFLVYDYGNPPEELFFTASTMSADAWFEVHGFGRVDANAQLSLDLEKQKVQLDGAFNSSVINLNGNLDLQYAELRYELEHWEIPYMPTEVQFKGEMELPGIALITGELEANLVANYKVDTVVPKNATFFGSYQELSTSAKNTLAEGRFSYDWTNAEFYDEGDRMVGLKAEFDGFIQEPNRPKVELKLKGDLPTLSKGTVEIDYAFGIHYLKGEAIFTNTVDSYGEIIEESKIDIVLRDEQQLEIFMNLNTEQDFRQTEVGKIYDGRRLLASIKMYNGVPHVFYPDGSHEAIINF